MAEKEVTESCVSVGDALASKEIKPSGTLGYRFIKRLFDLVFSLLMSVLLLIPIAIVCALISLESPGSPMYTQERVGKGGKTIKIFKLRSMVADAGDVRKYLSPEQLHQWEVERKVDGMSSSGILRMKRKPSCFLFSLASPVFGRQLIATRRHLRAACVRRSNSATYVIAASAWTGNALRAPLVPCSARRGRGDRCRQTLLLLIVC